MEGQGIERSIPIDEIRPHILSFVATLKKMFLPKPLAKFEPLLSAKSNLLYVFFVVVVLTCPFLNPPNSHGSYEHRSV